MITTIESVRKPINEPFLHPEERTAKNSLESLIYSDGSTITLPDGTTHPAKNIAPTLEYILVDAQGPTPVVLVQQHNKPNNLYAGDIMSQTEPGAPQSSYTTVEIVQPDGLRTVVCKTHGVEQDVIFVHAHLHAETPTTVINRQLDGSLIDVSLGQKPNVAVVLLDIQLRSGSIPADGNPIGTINFFPMQV